MIKKITKAQHRVYLIALASAHLENSFGIFSGKYLFTKLGAETRNEIIHKPLVFILTNEVEETNKQKK